MPTKKVNTAEQELEQQYLRFYQELANRLRQRVPSAIAEPTTESYCRIPSGLDRVYFEWSFWGDPPTDFVVKLLCEKISQHDNMGIVNGLRVFKGELEQAVGEEAFFKAQVGDRYARIHLLRNEGVITEELKSWAVEKMVLFYGFLQPRLRAVYNELK